MLQFAATGLETNRIPDGNECYIDFIAVKESRRNQNLGHRLMEEIIRLKENDLAITKLSLYVLKGNKRAEHLYRAYGFEEDKGNERPSYIFMVRE
ncbi:MAG: N-acetyltransferase [Alkalibacterium sp.]|nr:N-acetyltransferase [Alkalibacterium sp.]